MTTIAVFVGSLRADSLNKKLAQNLEKLAPKEVNFDYIDLNLPLYNQDLEAEFPAEVTELKKRVEAADGVLVVTPEYNRSIPGVLKNAIDWISRPYGHSSFDSKPLGIVGASGGPVGTAVAQSDMRHIAGYLNMRLMGQPELYVSFGTDKFNTNGKVVEESRPHLEHYITAYVEWVRREQNSDAN
jgi:chromate reductase, NAD(P)H dehydrogenase (quinone)